MNPLRTPHTVLVLLFLATSASSAEWPVPRGPSPETHPYRYDPAAWKKTPAEYLEDASACILHASSAYTLHADGTTELTIHDVTRLNGRKALEQLGEYRSITYDPTYQKLTLHTARVHKPDGRIVEVEPRHAQLRDQVTDYQVYDRDKQLILSFPGLEPGDVFEVQWTVRGKHPEYHGQFFTRYTFGDDQHPIVHDELSVTLPKERTLNWTAVGGKLEPDVTESDGRRTYRWRTRNRPRPPQDENRPSKETFRLQVACSTFENWDEVGRWKQRVRAECWECTEAVRRVVREVTRDLESPLERARALTYWVRRNIRYVSVGEKHDYTPHRPEQVLDNRFGDCKDASQLLAVMLREAGIQVELATLGFLGDGQVLENVPSPWGTHAVLLVTIDGKQHWIDTTTSLAAWDYLPRDDRDRLCYLVDDKGTLRLLRTPPLHADDNRIEQTTHVSVGADGSTRSDRTAVFHGSAALAQRDAWTDVPAGERRRLMTGELQDSNSRTRLLRLDIDETSLHDFDRPVKARMLYEISRHFVGDDSLDGSLSESKLWSKLLSYTLDYDRVAPLDLWMPFDLKHQYVVELPPAFVFDGLPRDRTVRSKWGVFQLTVHSEPANPRRLELKYHTRLEKVRVEPADFDAFRRFSEDVSKAYRVWLTVRPTDDLDDLPALEMLLQHHPEDAASALVLAKLYRADRKFADARRVLRRARYYRPDEAELWEESVRAAETDADEEALYREMVKRFPGEGRYRLRLGASLVNQGKHTPAREVLEPLAKKGRSADRALACYHLGRSAFGLNQPEQALHYLDLAEKYDSDAVNTLAALTFRARVCERLDRLDDAHKTYRRALRLNAESEELLAHLVRLSFALNRRDEALTFLRRYTLSVSDTAAGLAAAAEWHLKLGRDEDAFELASQSRERTFHAGAQRVLGLVYLRRSDFEKAAFHLSRADVDAEVLEGLIRSHLALGDLAEAGRIAEQAESLTARPATLEALRVRVAALLARRKALLAILQPSEDKLDRCRSALAFALCAEDAYQQQLPTARIAKLLHSAFAEGVEVGPALALRALLALESGRLDKAMIDAEKAVRLMPDHPRGYTVRGRVRLERGVEGALSDLAKAAELSERKDGWGLHWLALALRKEGKNREALTTQQEAARLLPESAEVREQLQELEKLTTEP